MDKDQYIDIINQNKELNDTSKRILLEQIKSYFEIKKEIIQKKKYKKGEEVKLKKGTLLHGTYKNLEGLKEITKAGLISSWFTDGRLSKYPSSVGVWNLKKDYILKEYINFYSGGTILYSGIFKDKKNTKENKTAVIPYDKMPDINEIIKNTDCHMWNLEETKEARFMPSLAQDRVQIGIIFNGDNPYTKRLLTKDILNPNNINDIEVKEFINPDYYEKFIKDRKNKDDFFTDRESAILFGIPENLIEGILVGKEYEKNKEVLKTIELLLPDCYICNLEGKVIVGNKC